VLPVDARRWVLADNRSKVHTFKSVLREKNDIPSKGKTEKEMQRKREVGRRRMSWKLRWVERQRKADRIMTIVFPQLMQ
jgi:hypothetical protein